MKWKRLISRSVSEVYALGNAGRAPQGLRVLLYHAVGSRLAHDPYGISVTPEAFKRQMKILKQRPASEVVPFDAPRGEASGLRVAVTFDDGYKDNLHTAAPVLLGLKIPFTVFVTSSFIRGGSADYLTPSELRELAALPGVTVGSHGATHVRLAECDDAALRHELADSRRALEDVTGREVRALSYPHGSVDRRVRDAARGAGYEVGGCSRFDINNAARDPLLLCRCEVVARDTERTFAQKLGGAWDWRRWRDRDPAAARRTRGAELKTGRYSSDDAL